MTAEVKTCKTCAHYRAFWPDPDLSRCDAYTNPVTGTAGALCRIEREGTGFRTSCGSAGNLWLPKPQPWWAFWKKAA